MSQTPTYVPQAGTIPAKVIAHLQSLPAGTELSTAMLIEAIGQPSDWHGLPQCLKLAVEHDVIHKRTDRSGWCMWSLVDQARVVSPVAPDAGTEGKGVDIDRAHAPAAASAPKAEQPAAAAAPQLDPADEDLVDVELHDFIECALTNTGRLLIDTGYKQISLSPQQAGQLMAYLDEQRGVEWEAA